MKKKKHILSLIVFLPLFLLLYTSVSNAQVLDLPYVEQEEFNWCWAACSQAILDYYGVTNPSTGASYSQCEIAEWARGQQGPIDYGNTDCCEEAGDMDCGSDPGKDPCCNQVNNMTGTGGISDILANLGEIGSHKSPWPNNVISKTQVQLEIDSFKPFIMLGVKYWYNWNTDAVEHYNHFIVCYGYTVENDVTVVHYLDPFFGEGFGSAEYSTVVKSYTEDPQDGAWEWIATLMLDTTGPDDGQDDHGHGEDGATLVTVNSCTSGSIETGGDYDWFVVDVPSSGTLTIYTEGNTDTYGYWRKSGTTTIYEDDDSGDGANFRFDIEDASAGTYYIAVSHASGDGTGNYRLCVEFREHDCQEYIIDNGDDPGTTPDGAWIDSGGLNSYENKSVFSRQPGDTYTFEAAVNGCHEVSLYWTFWGNRCSNVPVDIYDGNSLLDTVYKDQLQDGGQWNVLGTYGFTGTARVVIHSQGGCSTCADGVRFVRVADNQCHNVPPPPPPEIIIDNGDDPGTTPDGAWIDSGGLNSYENKSVFSRQPGDTYTFEAAVNGCHEVSLYWTFWGNRCSNVPVDIYDGNSLLDTVYKDQLQDGGQWNVLGTYGFTGTARVVIHSQGGCSTCADGVRFVRVADNQCDGGSPPPPPGIIIDNGDDPGTTPDGLWAPSGGQNSYGRTSVFNKTEEGGTYSFEAAVSGSYQVFLWWTYFDNRHTRVPVEIYDGTIWLDTVYVNQLENAAQWNELPGTYHFNGTARVVINSVGGALKSTCADAVKFVEN